MESRTYRHAEMLLVLAAVGGTSLFAPAAMARLADEYALAEAQRKETDSPVEERDAPRELLAEQQYLNWDRSVSNAPKLLPARQLAAAHRWSALPTAGPSEYDRVQEPLFNKPAVRRCQLNTVWPHAPPLPI